MSTPPRCKCMFARETRVDGFGLRTYASSKCEPIHSWVRSQSGQCARVQGNAGMRGLLECPGGNPRGGWVAAQRDFQIGGVGGRMVGAIKYIGRLGRGGCL
eukprot:scaffold24408_cov101-Isochrysis_galbana.AAC.1